MIRALVVYCHPKDSSFTAAVRDTVLSGLHAKGAEVRLIDLYAEGFDPVLSAADFETYETAPDNAQRVAAHVNDLKWCNTLIFIYPTWWYGLPAMLKGWLDRVFLPDVAFLMPATGAQNIRPGLSQIKRLGVFTTTGSSRWLNLLVGMPGKRTLFRGIGFLCHRPLRRTFAAHYRMDSSTDASRKAHLATVLAKLDRFVQ